MSMTRQMALLIVSLLLLACGGVWIAHIGSLQGGLRAQLQQRNAEGAQALAMELARWPNDPEGQRRALDAAMARGTIGRVTLRARDGQVLVERRAPTPPQAPAPRWFTDVLSLDVPAAHAPVGDAGAAGDAAAVVWLQSSRDWAVQALWQAAQRTAAWLGVLVGLGLVLAAWRLRRWREPLQQMAVQARELQEGRFQFSPEPVESELRPVVQSMNTLVTRLADQFAAQSTQVNTLHRLAHADATTGLARREAFLRRIGALTEAPECQGVTMLMLRLRNLGLLNEMVGHATVDGFLGAVGDMLDDYPSRVNGALAGRLNGSDLAVVLPARGVVRDTAQALADTLSALAERSMPALEFSIGAVESVGPMALGDLLAACDNALAQAEWRTQGRSTGGPRGDVAVRLLGDAQAVEAAAQGPAGAGARGWRARITAALDAGRVSVAQYPVVNKAGRLLHYECPLRVQPEPEGPLLAAGEWLPWASRSALLPQLELAGLACVLDAIASDGQRRSMHLCESSIVQSGAVQAICAVLDNHSLSTPLLCLEIAESTWARAPAPLAALGASLRERGVAIGLEHAGLALPSRAFVQGIALSYVKIDSRFVRQANSDVTARDLAVALVRQARSLGALAIAEGVADPHEVQGLFALGFDGVTGPGVQLRA